MESFLNTPLDNNSNINFTNICSNDSNVDTTYPTGLPPPFDLIHKGSVSETTYNYFTTVKTYIHYPLYIVALVSNVVNVVVYCQKNMKSPTSAILIALCSSEVLYILAGIGSASLELVYGDASVSSRVYLNYGLYALLYVAVSCRRAGFCYTLLVSAERFVAVSFPLHAKNFRLVKYPFVVCSLILVSVFAFHVFSPLKYTIIPMEANSTAYKFHFTNMYLANKVHFENVSMASKFIFVYTMLLGCLFFNLLIVISLKRHNKATNTMKTTRSTTDVDKRERQTTVTIMVSTVVYVLLALPANTNAIINNLRDDYGLFAKEHFLFHLMNGVGGTCELISNCTNFIFYVLLSAKFRQTLVQVFMPCVKHRPPQCRFQTVVSSSVYTVGET